MSICVKKPRLHLGHYLCVIMVIFLAYKTNMYGLIGPKQLAADRLPSNEVVQTFCDASHVGCFQYAWWIGRSVIQFRFGMMTVKECLILCASRRLSYAALHGNECMCARDIYEMASTVGAVGVCYIECPDSYLQTCGGKKTMDVYLIKAPCVKAPFDESYVTSRKRGCVNLASNHGLKAVDRAASKEQCLLICENLKRPLAVFGKRRGCFCGKASSRFSLMQKLDVCNTSDSVDVFRTTAGDRRCAEIRFLPPAQHNKTLLVSFPGSGNTWTRYMLERATGYYTGSVYRDNYLIRKGFLGEKFHVSDKRIDVIKDHLFDRKLKPLHSAIVIIRNPYRAFLSYTNFDYTVSQTDFAREDQIKTAFNLKRVQRLLEHWKWIPELILSTSMNVKVIYYEDILDDPIATIRKMVEFFPNTMLHPTDLEDRLNCLSQDTNGIAKRQPRKYSFNPFPIESRKEINRGIKDVRKILLLAGIKEVLPPYENDSEYS